MFFKPKSAIFYSLIYSYSYELFKIFRLKSANNIFSGR